MHRRWLFYFNLVFFCAVGAPIAKTLASERAQSKSGQKTSVPIFESLISVSGGTYKPLLGKGKSKKVPSFQIMETAVINQQFLEFVKHHPNWKRGSVPSIFADGNYLKHWKSPEEVGDFASLETPVVNVSWFAAQAYCEVQGLRLPRVEEWEYLAQFGPIDSKSEVKNIILEWYSKPNPKKLGKVRSTFANKFGVWDIHGLVWEWNYDFNSTFVTGESRGDSALEKSMFCGSGSVGAADPSDYAAFMRFGFRGSLKANYTVENLGFRCVKGDK